VQSVSSLTDDPLLGVAAALTVVIFLGHLVALGQWARAEANARDESVLGTFVMFAAGYGLVYYVWIRYVRNDWESRTEPADRRERLCTAYSLAVLVAFVVGALLTPPDPVTQVLALPGLFAVSFVLSYPFVVQRAVGGSGQTAT
jgi:sec-independent protein translocase protein TatC